MLDNLLVILATLGVFALLAAPVALLAWLCPALFERLAEKLMGGGDEV